MPTSKRVCSELQEKLSNLLAGVNRNRELEVALFRVLDGVDKPKEVHDPFLVHADERLQSLKAEYYAKPGSDAAVSITTQLVGMMNEIFAKYAMPADGEKVGDVSKAYALHLALEASRTASDIHTYQIGEYFKIIAEMQKEDEAYRRYQRSSAVLLGFMGLAISVAVLFVLGREVDSTQILEFIRSLLGLHMVAPANAQTLDMLPNSAQTKVIFVFLLFLIFSLTFLIMIPVAIFTKGKINSVAIDFLKTGFGFITGSLAGFMAA